MLPEDADGAVALVERLDYARELRPKLVRDKAGDEPAGQKENAFQ